MRQSSVGDGGDVRECDGLLLRHRGVLPDPGGEHPHGGHVSVLLIMAGHQGGKQLLQNVRKGWKALESPPPLIWKMFKQTLLFFRDVFPSTHLHCSDFVID